MQAISSRAAGAALALVLAGCQMAPPAPPAPPLSDTTPMPSSEYVVGPGDKLNIFVWRNPDLTVSVPVRPDGRISIPLVEDVVAVGKTASGLARDIEEQLKKYVKDPVVTVIGEGLSARLPVRSGSSARRRHPVRFRTGRI